MLSVYTAGPISGKSYDEVISLYKEKSKVLSDLGYKVYCPMTGKDYLRNEVTFKASGYVDKPLSTNHAIIERDRWMVGKVDIILCDLSNCGDTVSIGSVMELAWGYELRKQVIVVMQKDNIHRHAFVLEAADIIFETLEEAYDYLKVLNNEL